MTLEEAAKELDIDLQTALDRVVNNRDLYIRLLKVFIDDSYMNRARQAVADKDYESMEENVHSMKGSGASLGFLEMSAACHDMVTAIRQNQYEKIEELFARIEEEYAKVKAVISQLE